QNIEFLVKWKNWSHLHRTWENFNFLREFKGSKKVDNYVKNVAAVDISLREDPSVSKEDLEQRNINIEMERSVLVDYTIVERIVARREVTPYEECESGTQFLCKWKRLPYAGCTWEPSEIISEKFQDKIQEFLTRNQHRNIPSRGKSYTANNRPPFKKLDTQPDYLPGGTLRDYQLLGVNWMAHKWSNNENGILADEMGLGKTIQTISFLSYLFHSQQLYGPFLVVVPLSTIGAWHREFGRWAPDMNTICYTGDGESRNVLREHEFYVPKTKKLKFNVLLTTFELVLKDKLELGSIRWAFLAVDEAHRLKNSESQLHEALKGFNTTNRMLITGTPLQNSIKELSALVHFLMPDKFDISDAYDNIFTEESEGQEEKIRELHNKLESYMLRRLKKDVEHSLPKKTELTLRVELTPLQVHYYKNILAKNFAALNKGSSGGNQMSLLNVCAELKKASNHPYLFPNAEPHEISRKEQLHGLIANSGKMMLLDKLLDRLKENGSRVLIFSQMVRLLDILADYSALKGYPYQRLDGSVGSEARKKSIEHFNAPGSPDFIFLLSTRAGGLGINLETADTVIIFDSDWNPQNDLQAMARAHRIGQKKHVNVYRFISKSTMEEEILERAKRKMVLEFCVINQMDTSGQKMLQKGPSANKNNPFSREELQAILKFGAARMFNGDETKNKSSELSLDEILSSAEKTETTMGQTSLNGGEAFLKQFEVADYEDDGMAWDQIIPEHERTKVEEEEESVGAENLLGSRQRKQVNYQIDNSTVVANNGTTNPKPRKSKNVALTTKDLRAIYRGLLKFGNIPERFDSIVTEGNLSHIDRATFISKMNSIVSMCQDYEEANRPLQSRKAHLLEFEGLDGINVQSVLQRVYDFPLLHDYMISHSKSNIHLRMEIRPVTNWSVDWGIEDDERLLLGIYRHGFGNWAKIKEDPTLKLSKKLFLSDSDVPNVPRPTHLVRRGEYLLKTFAKYVEEKAKRRTSKHKRGADQGSSDIVNKGSKKSKTSEQNGFHSNDTNAEEVPDDKECIKILRPVKRELRKLRDEAKLANGQEKVQIIKACLPKIGKHIEGILSGLHKSTDHRQWKKALWGSVAAFWPNQVTASKVYSIYEKLRI
ncbi:hypothetical protein K502DRAFT_291427, partial [Neoconidiobolus thromboides FSU 785]